jgi:hypothetical protein
VGVVAVEIVQIRGRVERAKIAIRQERIGGRQVEPARE